MYLFIHIKANGSVNWSGTFNPVVPTDILEPGDLGVILHPLDVKTGPENHNTEKENENDS